HAAEAIRAATVADLHTRAPPNTARLHGATVASVQAQRAAGRAHRPLVVERDGDAGAAAAAALEQAARVVEQRRRPAIGHSQTAEIGRASCRERVESALVAVADEA